MWMINQFMKLFGLRGLEDDLQTEVQFHIDMRVDSNMNAGMPPDEAEVLARRQFGDVEAAMKGMRQARLRSTKAGPCEEPSSSVITEPSRSGRWPRRSATPVQE